jgi:TRAP-type transport system periplasmic protein
MLLQSRLARRPFLAALAVGTANGARAAGAAEEYTLRLNVNEGVTSAFALGAIHFATSVLRRSKGQLKVEVYPNHQLASQQESISALTSGALDFSIVGTAFLTSLVPRLAVFDMPFLCKDNASGYRLLDGRVADDFSAELEARGIVGVGWTGSFKELSTTTRAVVVPEDMKGLRIRIPNGAVFAATFQALGAIPVTIDVAESYLALQQHTVDGIDLNLDLIADGQYYNVIKHVAMTNHIFSVTPLLGSKRKIEMLPAPLQKIVREEGKTAIAAWRATANQKMSSQLDVLKKNGVAFTQIQYPAFRKAVDPVYTTFSAKLGADFLERVVRAAA